ncbi:hypothetical protein DERF_002670 [Dermatophagoides farinae]|uniref:Uncharacterized protein n=1 Tax=Dermatophagoides farinae TaxID=6954 RepID=A0A922IC44_DERFA|nr:hypothetical protein DERF_002670 [Dermatophagoides farinae]
MDNSPGWARIPLRCASYDEPTVYWPWTRRVGISFLFVGFILHLYPVGPADVDSWFDKTCGDFNSLVLSSKIFVFNTVVNFMLNTVVLYDGRSFLTH